jgi:hypothetical protein
MPDFLRILKINSIALWSLIAAIINLGILFSWWDMTTEQVAGINMAYAAGIIVFRQLFSITPPADER